MILIWCKFVKIYIKFKKILIYLIAIIFKIRPEQVLKKNCKVSMILAVFVIMSLYFTVLFYKDMQPISWET